MPLMTIDLASANPASKDASPLPNAAGGAANASATGASTSAGAFGQAMAQAFQKNALFGPMQGDKPSLPDDQAGAIGKAMRQMPADESGEHLAGQLLKAGAQETDTGTSLGALPVLLPPWLQTMTQALSVQAMTPNSSLQVITTSGPAPDDDSLIAFAQAQGMDAQTIAQLLGHPSAAGPMPGWAASPSLRAGAAPDATASGVPTSPWGAAQATATARAATPAQATVPSTTALSPVAPAFCAELNAPGKALLTPALHTPPLQTPPLQTQPLPSTSQQTQQLQTPSLQTPSLQTPQPPSDAQVLAVGVGVAGWRLTGDAPPPASNGLRNLQDAETPDMSPSSPLTPSLALPGMRRAAMGAAAADTMAKAASHGSLTSSQAQPWHESELDLSAAITADDSLTATDAPSSPSSPSLQTDSQTPRVVATQPLTLASGGSASGKTEGSSTLTPNKLASDQMQQLSEQMSDAIGERMVREIERGHWNLRLMLKPAHLGHIEVEMRLHAGGLEASFAAPQAATRELLQEGLDRLRASLSEMGMDIANLDVKTGQNRQNGGDPTPGQQASAGSSSGKNTTQQPAQTPGLPPRPGRADGWDVMV